MRRSDTSREAHERIRPHIGAQEQEVLSALQANGTKACHELEAITGLPHTSCSARLRGLEDKGLITKTDEMIQTPSGRNARRYRAVGDRELPPLTLF